MNKLGRNDPCPCGSGKRYKHCCGHIGTVPMASLDAGEASVRALQIAIKHHQSGRLPEAEALYRNILNVNPNHADALHLLGVVSLQRGEHESAISLINRAITVDPIEPKYHNNLGSALQAKGLHDEAIASYRRALSIKPDSADVCFNLANTFRAQGRLDDAVASYRQALTIEPNYADAYDNLGTALQAQGHLDEAIASYRRVLSIRPDSANAFYNLGKALQTQGLLDEAVDSYRQALSIRPDWADAYLNLGNIFNVQGKFDEAIECFSNTIRIRPDFAYAHNNLGCVLHKQDNLDEAITSFRRALELDPSMAEIHNNLGSALKSQGKLDEAMDSIRKAFALRPDYVDAEYNLGNVLNEQNKLDEAIESYRRVLVLDPEHKNARHMLASLTAETTERAPSQYVQELFDDYADKFDIHLVKVLQYNTPAELIGLIKRVVELPMGKWNVLDLGCGTGLMGQEIAPHASQLTGVDLSGRMLSKAKERNIYHRLVHSDLLAMMRSEKASSYDVIVAADVFVYLGKLDEIVGEIRRLLRPGGVFAFSIETLEPPLNEETNHSVRQEYQLKETGRYSQSISYLTKLAFVNDFLSQEMVAVQIRMEKGKPVKGHLVLWERNKQ